MFETCPFQYKWSCHDRRHPDIPVPKWAKLGWLVHATLRHALANGVSTNQAWLHIKDRANEIVREEVQSGWPDLELKSHHIPDLYGDDYYRIRQMLNNWDRFRGIFDKCEAIETEVKFNVVIKPEEKHSEEWRYRGTIDVRGREDDKWLIVDYKSSQPQWEHKTMPIQMWRYAVATALEFPVKSLHMVLFNLESNRKIHAVFDKKKGEQVIRTMQDQIHKIRNTHPSQAKANTGSHCWTLCAYQPSCPYARRKR